MRAVGSSLAVALVLGAAYLAYDVALSRGASLPGGDLRFPAAVLFVVTVLAAGSIITWLVVPLPRGSGTRTTRTPVECRAGAVRGDPDRVPRAGRRDPGAQAAADLRRAER